MVPSDAATEETLNGPSLLALVDLWHQSTEQRTADSAAVARRALVNTQAVSALDGLRANERIVNLLTGRRWHAMRRAREEGHSWSEIGAALNMSKQAAWESYKRAIEHQERYVPDLFKPTDSERYRAQLTDSN
jgi:predicted DNA-binding protein YlxM (UPF0122 family)